MLWSWIGRHYLVGGRPGARQAGSGWNLRTRPISPSRASRWSACCDLNATPESARSFASTDTRSCLAQSPACLAALRASLDVQRADGLRGVRCSSAQRRKGATSMVLYSHRVPPVPESLPLWKQSNCTSSPGRSTTRCRSGSGSGRCGPGGRDPYPAPLRTLQPGRDRGRSQAQVTDRERQDALLGQG